MERPEIGAHICQACMLSPGLFVPLAAAVRNAVDVPVIAVGKLGDLILAERTLQQGKANFIALGRPLLADPELPNKAKEGVFEIFGAASIVTIVLSRVSEWG